MLEKFPSKEAEKRRNRKRAFVVLLSLIAIVSLSMMTDPDDPAVALLNNLTSTSATSSLSASSASEVPQHVTGTVPSQSKVNTSVLQQTQNPGVVSATVSEISDNASMYNGDDVRFYAVISELIQDAVGVRVGMDVAGLVHASTLVLVEFPTGVIPSPLQKGDRVEITGSDVTVAEGMNSVGVLAHEVSLKATTILDLTNGRQAMPLT